MASSQPAQTTSVLSVQLSDLKGNQQPGRNRKRVKIIERVGIRMRMLTIRTRMVEMLGGKIKLNVRLISLASYVRTITSLTCALVLRKL